MTSVGPILETERLILRVPQAGDFDRYAELMADEDAVRYIGGYMPRAAAWRRFLQMPGAWSVQGFAMFSLIEKSSGRWLGQLGPWKPEGWPGNEIGYSLHRDAWGKGYAKEAAIAAIDWSFANLGWSDIIHCIDPDNQASIHLAERLGSTYRGIGDLPEPFQESKVGVWGQTREQWLARRSSLA